MKKNAGFIRYEKLNELDQYNLDIFYKKEEKILLEKWFR